MAKNFKKLETLVKNFATMATEDALKDIIKCNKVDVESLTDNEKLSVLVYAEMSKALEDKEHMLVLDCNYPQSKKHNKTEAQIEKGQEDEWLVDYYRLVSKASKNQSMIQFYVKPSYKNGTCTFSLCTSCAKANREQFEAVAEELEFKVKRDKKGVAKTTYRSGISYDELVSVVKAVCAVLATQPGTEEETEEE